MHNKGDGEKKIKLKRPVKALLIFLLVAAAAGILLKLILFPPYDAPAVSGDHVVLTKEYTWVDENRVETFTDSGENRELTIKFWYPEEAGSYPLVIFSHGAFGVIDSNYSTCMELASNGYVVASIGHTYHAMYLKNVEGKIFLADKEFVQSIFVGNGVYDPELEKQVYENSLVWMELRTADENFVLDTVLEKAKKGEEAPFGLIDTDKIGLMGHSLGGASSVQLGRERTDIGAVIDLEGTMLGEYTGFENGIEIYNEEPYPVPVLDVFGIRLYDEIKMPEDFEKEHPDWKYVNFYMGERAADYMAVAFHDAGHLNFTDLPLISPVLAKLLGVGKVDAKSCMENVNAIVLEWFDHYLKGNSELDIKPEY